MCEKVLVSTMHIIITVLGIMFLTPEGHFNLLANRSLHHDMAMYGNWLADQVNGRHPPLLEYYRKMGALAVSASLIGILAHFCGEKGVLLFFYTVISAVLIIIGLVVLIRLNTIRSMDKKLVHEILHATLLQYDTDLENKQSWDKIHEEGDCCGVHGPADWNGTTLPPSCCRSSQQKTTEMEAEANNTDVDKSSELCNNGSVLREKGCGDFVVEILKVTASIAFGFGVPLVISVAVTLFPMWIYRTPKFNPDIGF